MLRKDTLPAIVEPAPVIHPLVHGRVFEIVGDNVLITFWVWRRGSRGDWIRVAISGISAPKRVYEGWLREILPMAQEAVLKDMCVDAMH